LIVGDLLYHRKWLPFFGIGEANSYFFLQVDIFRATQYNRCEEEGVYL